MIVLPFLTYALTPDGAWVADICLLVIFGVFGGLVQSSTYGLAGMLPPQHMGAVMLGNGFSGLAINAIRAICLAIIPPSSDAYENFKGSLAYFIIASVILMICAVGMVVFQKMSYA